MNKINLEEKTIEFIKNIAPNVLQL